MNTILPDLFRCLITNIMIAVLIYIMSKPKYKSKWTYITVTAIVVIVNMAADSFFYLQHNYNSVVTVDLIMLMAIAVVLKPLFLDSVMQWCFSFITVLNIYTAVVFASYFLCDFFPYPYWSNSILRLIFFCLIAVLFWHFIRPFYYKIVEHWHVYSLLTIALLANFLYYLFTKDIKEGLTENVGPIVLLIIMGIFLYIGIFNSFKIISNEYALREEKIKLKAQRSLLESELSSYDEFLQSAKQSRHDLRHHNSIVLEYLTSGDIKGAEEYLKCQINDLSRSALETYCENPISNAVFLLYASKARSLGISYGVQADIPKELPLSDTEMGSMLSNILENAIHACENQKANDRFIRFLAERNSYTLKIELRNSVFGETVFDKNAMPVSQKEEGGIGTLSVYATVKRHGGMVSFSQEKNAFITRIVLPLK